MEVTIITPSLPERNDYLVRASWSVGIQTVPAIHLYEVDKYHEGPIVIRNRLLAQVTTPYVGFLDDRDELHPDHVQACLEVFHTDETACVVYPWFRYIKGGFESPSTLVMHVPSRSASGRDLVTPFGRNWPGPESFQYSNYVPITVIAKTQCIREAGGFSDNGDVPMWTAGDSVWALWSELANTGHTFVHVPEKTWDWHDSKYI